MKGLKQVCTRRERKFFCVLAKFSNSDSLINQNGILSFDKGSGTPKNLVQDFKSLKNLKINF